MLMKHTKSDRFKPVEIGNVGGTKAVLQAVKADMTAIGGAPMLAGIERKVGLVAKLCERVHDSRKEHLTDHKAQDILLQRVCQIGAGFSDGNDCDFLRMDPAILESLDRDPVNGQWGASQETVCRFEKKAIDRKNLKFVRELFVDHFISRQKMRPREIELDLDGTIVKTYGAQEGAIYRGGKYNHEIYFPLQVYCGEWLLGTVLRQGNKAESRTVLDTLKMIVSKLRAKWPGLKIKVRLDAAFGSPELYAWLKKEKIGYLIAIASNSVLELEAKRFMEEVEEKFRKEHGEPRFMGKDGKQKAQAEHTRIREIADPEKRTEEERKQKQRRSRVVGECSTYKPETWKKFLEWDEFVRVIFRVDFTDKGLDVHYVVVSHKTGIAQEIYEKEYCKRGLTEQHIGQFKQTGMRLSAQQFFTNQMRLTLYGVAYMLMFHLREKLNKKLRKASVETIRKTLMLMPMVVQSTGKKIVLQISENHPNCRTFLDAWRRLSAA
jgi:predicted secreted acid phosphatase